MALLFLEDFKDYSNLTDMAVRGNWVLPNTTHDRIESSGAYGRNSAYSYTPGYEDKYLEMPTSFFSNTSVGNSGNELYLAFDMDVEGTGVDYATSPLIVFSGGSNGQTSSQALELWLTSSSGAYFSVGGSSFFNSAGGVFVFGTLQRWEMLVSKANSGGVVKLWIDGSLVIDGSGDTHRNGDTRVNWIGFGNPSNNADAKFHFSNIVIADSTVGVGPDSTDFPLGVTEIISLDSTNADWDETPNDGDTTEITITDGTAVDHPTDDMPAGRTIIAAQANYWIKNADTVPRAANLRVDRNGTILTSPIVAPISSSYIPYFFPFDPVDETAVNATSLGVQLTDV